METLYIYWYNQGRRSTSLVELLKTVENVVAKGEIFFFLANSPFVTKFLKVVCWQILLKKIKASTGVKGLNPICH